MENAPAVIDQIGGVVNFDEYAMSSDGMLRQVQLIQEVMGKTMKDKEHYGTIPGCGNKPTLLKPGAEKLSTVFRLAPEYDIKQTELANNHREYMIICKLIHIPTGQFVGSGVGSCSTMEGKYRFRNAEKECPVCKNNTIIKGKQEYGGGWLCYKNKGGCGQKWKDGAQEIEGQESGKVEQDNPADYYNTVLKMGKKRAHVDAVLTATSASDIFTQDIEDIKSNLDVVEAEFTEVKEAPKQAVKPAKQEKAPEAPPKQGKTQEEIDHALYSREMRECKKKNPILFAIVAENLSHKKDFSPADLSAYQCKVFVDEFIQRDK